MRFNGKSRECSRRADEATRQEKIGKSASRDSRGFQQRGVNLAAVVNSAPKAVLEGRDAGLNLEGQGRRHLLFPLGSLLRAATQP